MTAPEDGQSPKDHEGLDAQDEWVPEFKPGGGGIDGVLTVTGDSLQSIERKISQTFNWVFNVDDKQASSVEIVYEKEGKVLKGHAEQSALTSPVRI